MNVTMCAKLYLFIVVASFLPQVYLKCVAFKFHFLNNIREHTLCHTVLIYGIMVHSNVQKWKKK